MRVLIAVCIFILAENAAVRIGTLSDPEIKEASGIVKSRTHAGVYWVHNDSGNPPALFAVREDGSVLRRYDVSVPNVDWEDIATDGDGHLYLGDIGNNGGRLLLRAIYRLDEPDPSRAPDGPLKPTLSVYYKLPKEDRFDAESLVIDGENALLITKKRDGAEAELKTLALDGSSSLLRPAVARSLGILAGFVDAATGADLSPDGDRLAVVSLETVRVYRRDGDGWKVIGRANFQGDGVEAVAWDGDDLVLAGEGRGIYRIPARRWRRQAQSKDSQR